MNETDVRLHLYFPLGLLLLFEVSDAVPNWLPYFVVGLIASILFHDAVRVATASAFRLKTTELILLPTGGQTSFSEYPSPGAEISVNTAGILTFMFLTVTCGLLSHLRHEPVLDLVRDSKHITLLQALYVANLTLAAINMLPVFPLDMGFILRGILSIKFRERRATSIVGKFSQFFALALGFFGLTFFYFGLIIPAIYIFFSANFQRKQAGARVLLKGQRVQDAMQVNFTTVESGASLDAVAKQMVEGSQHDFPVLVGDEVVGVLTRADIARGIARSGPSGYVAGHMKREFPRIPPEAELEEAANILGDFEGCPILVMEGDSLVGLLSKEKLNDYLLLVQAKWLANRRERSSRRG